MLVKAMPVPELTLSNWMSIVAVFVAIASVIVACASYRLARKSYSLAEDTANLSRPNSAVYLIDAFRYRSNKHDKTLYVFCVSIENKSTFQNSIVNVEMRLPYIRDGIERLVVLSLTNNLSKLSDIEIRNTIQLPASLPVRGALIVNCCFEAPNELLERAEFDLHVLRIRYADGPFSELKPKLIMDVIDVQELEKKRKTGVPI